MPGSVMANNMTAVVPGSERRSGKRHQQQGGNNILLHSPNRSTAPHRAKAHFHLSNAHPESRVKRPRAIPEPWGIFRK
jgi:hypothetical protein